jgi:hypothetical protein
MGGETLLGSASASGGGVLEELDAEEPIAERWAAAQGCRRVIRSHPTQRIVTIIF